MGDEGIHVSYLLGVQGKDSVCLTGPSRCQAALSPIPVLGSRETVLDQEVGSDGLLGWGQQAERPIVSWGIYWGMGMCWKYRLQLLLWEGSTGQSTQPGVTAPQVTDQCRKGRLQLAAWMGTKFQAANRDEGDPVWSAVRARLEAAIGCQAGEPRRSVQPGGAGSCREGAAGQVLAGGGRAARGCG